MEMNVPQKTKKIKIIGIWKTKKKLKNENSREYGKLKKLKNRIIKKRLS